MHHLVCTFLVPDSRLTGGEKCKLGIPWLTLNDALNREVSVAESKRGLEWLYLIWDTMTRKVHPFVLPEFLADTVDARLFTLDAPECGEAINALTNVVQFGPDGNNLILALGVRLTYTNKVFPF